MSHPGRATNEAANNEWREVLATIKEDILALVANKKDGVTADECSSVRTLGWTLADPLRGLTKTPISPGYSGPLAEARCEDELTKRLLCGAQVWDGGNRGVPLQTRKVGACFCDALALGVFGGGLEAADDAWQYSLPIRVAIVQQGGFSLGFDEDNAREYAEDLAREEAGPGQEGGVWRV